MAARWIGMFAGRGAPGTDPGGSRPLPMGLFDSLAHRWLGPEPETTASLDVEPAPSASGEAPDRALSGVVSVEPRWRRGLSVVLDAMPDVDDALAEEGDDVYLRMENDPDVSAALDQLDRRVLGRDLEWAPPVGLEGDPFAVEVADYVSRVVRSELDLRGDLLHLFRAKTRRLAVSQVVWRRGDGRHGEPVGTWVPDRMRAEDERRFRRTRDGGLYAFDGTKAVLLTPPGRYDRKFVYAAHGFEPRRPQGRSVLDRVYWPWKMLRAAEGFWLDTADRFAVPPIVGILELVADMADAGQVDKVRELTTLVAESLSPLQSGSTAAFVGKDVKTLTASGAFDFAEFTDYLIRRVRKGLLSTTLTVDTNGVGARAHAEEHSDEVDGVAQWHGADLARTVERTLGRWTALFRYGPRAATAFPRASFDWRTTATFDQYLRAAESGIPVSREAAYTVYNVPRPADDDDAYISEVVTATPAAPAEVGFSDSPFGSSPTGRRRRTTTRPS